jgi:DNA-binding response OmpR family regulator
VPALAFSASAAKIRGVRILIADDELAVREAIGRALMSEGYDVAFACDGREALIAVERDEPDAAVLDVMMPAPDGLEVCRQLRSAENTIPILMLTARRDVSDRVAGLDAGADDYLPKPFDLPVLLARVKGLIRRRDWARGSTADAVRIGPALVDFANFELRKGDALVRLTLLEAMLLKLLVEQRGQVVTKAEILEKVWNLNPDTETRAVDNFVMRLRRHLEEDARDPRLLQTVRGVGYRLQD